MGYEIGKMTVLPSVCGRRTPGPFAAITFARYDTPPIHSAERQENN
jgi:hypothetical protein